MKQVERVFVELQQDEDDGPAFRVVAASVVKQVTSAPLILPSRHPSRVHRPELAALGWPARAARLTTRLVKP